MNSRVFWCDGDVLWGLLLQLSGFFVCDVVKVEGSGPEWPDLLALTFYFLTLNKECGWRSFVTTVVHRDKHGVIS